MPLVARQVDVSPSYLTALFHKNLQISPGEYIRWIKLQESKQMIRENDLNFTEIAAQLHYSTVHHFSRQFKEKFGITPHRIRKICSLRGLENEKGNPIALLPIGVFLVLYLGLGLLFEYGLHIPMGFYNIPIVIAFLVSILVACLQNRAVPFEEKLVIMGQGVEIRTSSPCC